MSNILLTVAWRLAWTVRHAIGKFASHIVVVLVVEHVADVEDYRLIPEAFPPVRSAAGFRTDVACFVNDRFTTIAGVFDNLALGHEDQRRAIGVAVPGH